MRYTRGLYEDKNGRRVVAYQAGNVTSACTWLDNHTVERIPTNPTDYILHSVGSPHCIKVQKAEDFEAEFRKIGDVEVKNE